MSNYDISRHNTDKQPASKSEQEVKTDIAHSRREVLQKLGKGSLYIPPLMVSLLITEKQAAASLGGPPPPP